MEGNLPPSGAVTTLSVFRFDGVLAKLWAFGQMGLARPSMRRLPGCSFFKLFGSGSQEGFHPNPNWSVYAIMASFGTEGDARRALDEAPVYSRFRRHASEHADLFLRCSMSHGRWAGREPFTPVRQAGERATSGPIGVLTRATIRPTALLRFWRSVPDIAAAIRENGSMGFKMGLGEIPWVHQVTLSFWPNEKSIREFAYKTGPHAKGIEAAREGGWFSEELFARFHLLEARGQWQGEAITASIPSAHSDIPEPATL